MMQMLREHCELAFYHCYYNEGAVRIEDWKGKHHDRWSAETRLVLRAGRYQYLQLYEERAYGLVVQESGIGHLEAGVRLFGDRDFEKGDLISY